jgi:thiol:disulfide interchange protein
MTRLRKYFAVYLVVGALVALNADRFAVGGAAEKSDDHVKVSVKSQKSASDRTETVFITLTIEKGWHAYANPVGLDDLASSQTTVTVDGKPKPEIVKINYPPGKLVKDSVVGDHKVYEDEVTIKAEVRRGDAGPLTVAVKFQVCNDKKCLLPSTVKTTLP